MLYPLALFWEGATTRVGIGAARQDRIPRWLVEIRRLGRHYYLSNVAGQLSIPWPDRMREIWDNAPVKELEDITWDLGVVEVAHSQYEVDLADMSIPLPSATIHLTPDIARHFDPMTQLSQVLARVSYYDGKKVRPVVRGSAEDIQIGDTGEITSFSVVEKWRISPFFPPAINKVGERVAAERVIDGSEDQAYVYAFGDAWAVRARAIRSFGADDPTGGNVRYLYHGSSLTRSHGVTEADRDPVPYANFPHEDHPRIGPLKSATIVGLWYGKNRCIRDSFERVGLATEWEVVAGTFDQNENGAINLESTTADSTLKWTDWNYQETLSVAVRAIALDAGAYVVYYWNYVDADNHARVEFKTADNKVRLVVMEAAVATTDEEKDLAIGASEMKFNVDIDSGGSLTVAVQEKGAGVEAIAVEFGQVTAAVGGRFAIGSLNGKVRWRYLQQPSMRTKGSPETDVNAGIRHRKDLLNHSIVAEDFRDQPGEPIYVDFRHAHNCTNAGRLLGRLIYDYSGLDHVNINVHTIEPMIERLRRFRVGGYFDKQEPLFDLVSERLSKQFMFAVHQQGGKLNGFQVDPTREPSRKLVYGVDLLQLHEPIREYEKFNAFFVQWKWNAAREVWGKKDELTDANFSYFLAHRRRYGANPFPFIDLPDVTDDGTAYHIMLMYALIFHAGQRVVYLQRATPGGDLYLGEDVAIDDELRGFVDKRAIFVGQQIIDESYVANVFRTVEFFEEAGSGGSAVGVYSSEPDAGCGDPVTGSELMTFGNPCSCWTAGAGLTFTEGIGPSGEDGYIIPPGTDAVDHEIAASCECSMDPVGVATAWRVGVTRQIQSAPGVTGDVTSYRLRANWSIYSDDACTTLVNSGSAIINSGTTFGGPPGAGAGAGGLSTWDCFSFAPPSLAPGQKGRITWVIDRTTVAPGPAGFAGYRLVSPWISTNASGAAPNLC